MLFILVFVFIIPLNFLLIENFICQLNLLQDALRYALLKLLKVYTTLLIYK